MNDTEFVHAFEVGHLPHFHHRDHLRLAWALLREAGWDAGTARLRDSLLHFAAAHGAPGKYHETMTLFWARVVEHAMASWTYEDFESFLAAHPLLLDATLPTQHYSPALLWSDAARAAWVEPDLLPLPALSVGG